MRRIALPFLRQREMLLWHKPEACEFADIAYLTGFRGTTAWAAATPRGVWLFVDARYHERARNEAHEGVRVVEVPVGAKPLEAVAHFARAKRARSALVDPSIPALVFRSLRRKLRASGITTRLARKPLLREARSRKRPEEIAALERAQALTQAAIEAALASLAPGKTTERELALELEWQGRRRGAERAAFPPIVAFGPNSALPHATARDARVAQRGALLIDAGFVLDGYCGDCTRTFWIGGKPEQMFLAAYNTVFRAYEAARRAATFARSAEARAIDAAARQVIDASIFRGAFLHSTGHGVGLEIHESPFLSRWSDEVLGGGEVVTIEPGIYLSGKFGVRLEDMVVAGEGRVLGSEVPREVMCR